VKNKNKEVRSRHQGQIRVNRGHRDTRGTETYPKTPQKAPSNPIAHY